MSLGLGGQLHLMTDDEVNRSLVMVVGESRINCIVISRVVERVGLKVTIETPLAAPGALLRERPAIAILDGGPQNSDCDGLIDHLEHKRRASARGLPAVILLSTANLGVETAPIAKVVDMVVAKPLTVDRLQPAIETLRAKNGDYSSPSA